MPEEKQQLVEENDADNIRKVLVIYSVLLRIFILIRTESTVLIRSGYSFVAVEVKV